MAEGARLVIQDLIDCVRALPVHGDGSDDRVTLTIGVFTRVPEGELQPHHFVEGADNALYRAKDNGRDGYVIDGELRPLGVVDSIMYPGTQAFLRFVKILMLVCRTLRMQSI